MEKLQALKEKTVRCIYDETEKKWYFSVVDVCGILFDTPIPQVYWCDLKRKLKDSGFYEKPAQKMFQFAEGKSRAAEVFDADGLLRLVRSVRSPKAELFKIWLYKAKINLKKYSESYADSAKICVCFSMRELAG